jgi:hypothetical protein
MMSVTRLQEKLDRIRRDPGGSKDFLICDAKDNDMGGGVTSPGPKLGAEGRPTGAVKNRADYLQQVRDLVRQDIVDLMLMSVSNLEILVNEGVFEGSRVGKAIRANDTTDIWGPRGGQYSKSASLPFRTAHIPHAMYGRSDALPGSPPTLADLGLYSITFCGDPARDREALEHYRAFRLEAEPWGFKHFLEVFNPNVNFDSQSRREVGAFVNDSIIHTLAGVPQVARPQFLKMPYNGVEALSELANYDPTLIIGILGGGAGTARDTFELLARSKRHGARLVLFGRKINMAEDPLALVAMMRRVADEEIGPEEAVRAYHDQLRKNGLAPTRALEKDIEITEDVLK